MARRSRAVPGQEDVDPAGPFAIEETPDPEAERLLEAGSYREYLKRRAGACFPQLATAFLGAAATGSAVHMRMLIALMDDEPADATEPAGSSAVETVAVWEELNRRGEIPNL